MKIIHLSDLHIGKQLNGYSLKENQQKILRQAVDVIRKEQPDVILLCGDIYDKAVPSGEAFAVFNQFLNDLNSLERQIPVLIIAGNHDSPQRLSFASGFLEKHHIYMSVLPPQKPEERLKKIVVEDEFGPVNFYLLPFMKPGYVRGLFEKEGAKDIPGTYEEAVRAVLARETVNPKERNVILSHQFYTSKSGEPETCGSEQVSLSVGGVDKIDVSVLDEFDYAALGHLHKAQQSGRREARYCGTLLKYSVSEEKHKKSITLVTMEEKGKPVIMKEIPVTGIQDVRREKGSLEEILSRVTENNRHDFVSVTITDNQEPYHFREKLQENFDFLLEIKVDNERTRKRLEETACQAPLSTPFEAFCSFYETVCRQPLTEEEEKEIKKVLAKAEEEQI